MMAKSFSCLIIFSITGSKAKTRLRTETHIMALLANDKKLELD